MRACISLISGDLVNSRFDKDHYISGLHQLLTLLQQASHMRRFDSFRGDAFRAEAKTTSGLLLAVYIRVGLKIRDAAEWDARVALGLDGREMTASGYGSAFFNTGSALDAMAKIAGWLWKPTTLGPTLL